MITSVSDVASEIAFLIELPQAARSPSQPPTYWGHEEGQEGWTCDINDAIRFKTYAEADMRAAGCGVLDYEVIEHAWIRPANHSHVKFMQIPTVSEEEIARAMAFADSRELILATSNNTQLGHASDANWKEYMHMAKAVLSLAALEQSPANRGEPVAWLRAAPDGDTAAFVTCDDGDEGAFPVYTPESAGPKSEGRKGLTMNDEQVKYMVDRFLAWRLPEHFNPDGGISFKKTFNDHMPQPMKNEPIGTNLFDATQTDAMVRHMLEGLPSPAFPGAASNDAYRGSSDCSVESRHAASDTCAPKSNAGSKASGNADLGAGVAPGQSDARS